MAAFSRNVPRNMSFLREGTEGVLGEKCGGVVRIFYFGDEETDAKPFSLHGERTKSTCIFYVWKIMVRLSVVFGLFWPFCGSMWKWWRIITFMQKRKRFRKLGKRSIFPLFFGGTWSVAERGAGAGACGNEGRGSRLWRRRRCKAEVCRGSGQRPRRFVR